MADLRGFDANQVEPSSDIDPVPAGKYLAVITESEMKPNKAGTGHYLQLTFAIIEDEHKGRFLWARLNLDNPNAVAVAIAKAELSAICRAVGQRHPAVETTVTGDAAMLEVELPYPPSINHYWRRVGPKTLISREGRRFRASVVAIHAAR